MTLGEKSILGKTLKSPGNSDETSEPPVMRIVGTGGLGVPPKVFRVHNRPCLFEQFLREAAAIIRVSSGWKRLHSASPLRAARFGCHSSSKDP